MKEIKTREDGHRSIKYDHSRIIEKIRQGMNMSEEETLKHFPEGEIGEIFEAIVSDMEGDGIDFKEEVGFFQVEIPRRPDLSFTVYIVDKKTEDVFSKYEGFH